MLEWLGEKKAAAEQLCMDNISTGLDDRVEPFIGFIRVSVNIPVILLPSFRIFTEPFFCLTLIFFPPYMIAIDSLFEEAAWPSG